MHRLPQAPRLTLAMAPRHRLLNIQGRSRGRRGQSDASSLLDQKGVGPPEETGMGGQEGRQEPGPVSPCAGDRLVDVFVGKVTVHWLRTSCKHGASEDHLGGQLLDRLG